MATEWDDIQRRIGNRPNEIYVEEESLNKFILEEVESKGDMRQYSSLNELDEMLEETVEDEDERMLLEYRKKRLAEMKAQAAGNRFGRCVEITKSSFIDEVSSTSHSHPVICLIFKRGNERGELLGDLLGEIARRFPDIKFVKMADDQKANLGYINKGVLTKSEWEKDPMMVKYENGEPISSYRPDMAKIREADDLEWSMSNKEWIKSEMEEDPRINQPNRLIINVKRKQSNKDVFASSA